MRKGAPKGNSLFSSTRVLVWTEVPVKGSTEDVSWVVTDDSKPTGAGSMQGPPNPGAIFWQGRPVTGSIGTE